MNLFESIEKVSFSTSQDAGFLSSVQRHFEERISNLKTLLSLRSEERDFEPEIFILTCCFIDAFAGIFYGDESGLRFRKILYEFGEFGNANFNKVSLIELEKVLSFNGKFSELRDVYLSYIADKIAKIDYANIRRAIEHDPLKDALVSELLHIKEFDPIILKDVVENVTHASVLYKKYRCPVIHEGIPRNHWNIADENYVHYMGIIDARADLVFPAKFLIDLSEHIHKQVFIRVSNTYNP